MLSSKLKKKDAIWGNIDKKIVIPIGVNAHIDTTKDRKIKMMEKCVE